MKAAVGGSQEDIAFSLKIVLSLGMSDPKPCFIDADGKAFYNVEQAAKVIGRITKMTLARWTESGVTSFGFKLDVKLQPLLHGPKGYRHDAKTHREFRRLISEEQVLELKAILEEARKDREEVWSPALQDRLEATAASLRRRQRLGIARKHVTLPRV